MPLMTGDGAGANGSSRPILLLGVARSGTSWLGHTLGRAPGVRFYYEPDNIDADPTGARRPGGLGFGPYPIIDVNDSGSPFAAVWDLVFAGRMPEVEKKPILLPARLVLRLPRRIRDPLVHGAAAAMARFPLRGARPIVKSIYTVFSAEWLTARYRPDVLVIQRNPLNVISSWRQLDIPLFDLSSRRDIRERYLEPLGIDPPADRDSSLARIAWHVALLTHVLGETSERHPEWRLITHEDLCVEPMIAMRAIFDEVGLTWTSEVERFLEASNRPGEGLKPVRVSTEQPDRWRKRLTPDEVREIEDVLARFPRRGWLSPPPPGA